MDDRTPVENRAAEAPAVEGTTVLIRKPHDPDGLAGRAPVTATIERSLTSAGFAPLRPDAGSDLSGDYVLSPTVEALTITTSGSSTTISCTVTLRVAPWSDGERWEPSTTATARGEARATTSNAPRQIELGTADCLESAVRAATTRQVIPFLHGVVAAN